MRKNRKVQVGRRIRCQRRRWPPKPETVYKALQKAGIDVDRTIFENLNMIPGKFLKRYKDKPEFDESLFKIF
jgi:hypothetical protein